jgi:hypothetical protein
LKKFQIYKRKNNFYLFVAADKIESLLIFENETSTFNPFDVKVPTKQAYFPPPFSINRNYLAIKKI